ncbi:C1_2 domain-containing protein [Psidium guajava]|nr:C1_2 domain-containing protein [Psidium guajava]
MVCRNAAISYCQNGQAEKALEYFGRVKDTRFERNSITLITVIGSYARLVDPEGGKKIRQGSVRRTTVATVSTRR